MHVFFHLQAAITIQIVPQDYSIIIVSSTNFASKKLPNNRSGFDYGTYECARKIKNNDLGSQTPNYSSKWGLVSKVT